MSLVCSIKLSSLGMVDNTCSKSVAQNWKENGKKNCQGTEENVLHAQSTKATKEFKSKTMTMPPEIY